jgi:hypothetical protein
MMKVEDRLQNGREESHGSLLSDLDEDEVKLLLQPVLSPIAESFSDALDNPLDVCESAEDDDECWTTDSDLDSWDEDTETDDDPDDDFFSKDSRFIDSAWGGECLRELEDIDFEFVYALHTFVATVEGQANATKGDTMVLLDDSNSYWWLVRVVKDSSIGMDLIPHLPTRGANTSTRLPPCRTHRNTNRKISPLEQAPEYRSLGDHAWRYCRENEKSAQESDSETKC